MKSIRLLDPLESVYPSVVQSDGQPVCYDVNITGIIIDENKKYDKLEMTSPIKFCGFDFLLKGFNSYCEDSSGIINEISIRLPAMTINDLVKLRDNMKDSKNVVSSHRDEEMCLRNLEKNKKLDKELKKMRAIIKKYKEESGHAVNCLKL